jgi:subtilisin family serine protease
MRTAILAFALLFVAVLNAAPLLHADKENIIPNEYLVIFNEDITEAQEKMHFTNLTTHSYWTYGANEIKATWSIKFFKGYHLYLDNPKILDLVLASSDVQFVEPNGVVTKSKCVAQTSSPWGLARINLNDVGADGATYTRPDTAVNKAYAYVIDTGINTAHSDFGGRATFGASFITGETNDGNGHGTHVAGTIGGKAYGVSQTINLIAVKVLSNSGSGSNAGVVSGIEWVAKNGGGKRSVANLSLGGGASTATDNAIAALKAAGVVVVVAAGNDGANACNYSPARSKDAITVGATDSSDIVASFSNIGSCVNIFAPGVGIKSAWYTSNTATSTISGTSMASPHVAGVAALYLEQTSLSATEIYSKIISVATHPPLSRLPSGTTNAFLYAPCPLK